MTMTLTIPANGLLIEKSMTGIISQIKMREGKAFMVLDTHPALDILIGDTVPDEFQKGTAVTLTRQEGEGEPTYLVAVTETTPVRRTTQAPASSPAMGEDLSMFAR